MTPKGGEGEFPCSDPGGSDLKEGHVIDANGACPAGAGRRRV